MDEHTFSTCIYLWREWNPWRNRPCVSPPCTCDFVCVHSLVLLSLVIMQLTCRTDILIVICSFNKCLLCCVNIFRFLQLPVSLTLAVSTLKPHSLPSHLPSPPSNPSPWFWVHVCVCAHLHPSSLKQHQLEASTNWLGLHCFFFLTAQSLSDDPSQRLFDYLCVSPPPPPLLLPSVQHVCSATTHCMPMYLRF